MNGRDETQVDAAVLGIELPTAWPTSDKQDDEAPSTDVKHLDAGEFLIYGELFHVEADCDSVLDYVRHLVSEEHAHGKMCFCEAFRITWSYKFASFYVADPTFKRGWFVYPPRTSAHGWTIIKDEAPHLARWRGDDPQRECEKSPTGKHIIPTPHDNEEIFCMFCALPESPQERSKAIEALWYTLGWRECVFSGAAKHHAHRYNALGNAGKPPSKSANLIKETCLSHRRSNKP